MLARRIHVYTHQIHATLHGLIQTLFQGVLLYVVLVLADTDTLRVDLDQLGQRVHQPATDADSSAYRDVVFGKLLPSDLGRGVDRGSVFADYEHLYLAVVSYIRDELLGLTAGRTITDGNGIYGVSGY